MGNKNDDPARKQVDTQDAVRFGESMGVRVFETSAKENINVEEVTLNQCFHRLLVMLLTSANVVIFRCFVLCDQLFKPPNFSLYFLLKTFLKMANTP